MMTSIAKEARPNVAREFLADLASTACDSETTPEETLDCFDAAEAALQRALAPQERR